MRSQLHGEEPSLSIAPQPSLTVISTPERLPSLPQVEKRPDVIAALSGVVLGNTDDQFSPSAALAEMEMDMSVERLDVLFSGVFQHMLAQASASKKRAYRRQKYTLARQDSLEVFTYIAQTAASNGNSHMVDNVIEVLETRNHPDFHVVAEYISNNYRPASDARVAAL